MSFLASALAQMPYSTFSSNSTASSLAQIPLNLLETFIPGYTILSRFLLEVLGFDVTLVVSVSFVFFFLTKSILFLWNQTLGLFNQFCTSQVVIESDVDVYTWLMQWVDDLDLAKYSRSVIAEPDRTKPWDLSDDDFKDSYGDFDMFLSARASASTKNIRPAVHYEPAMGSQYLWHKRQPFWFTRTKVSVPSQPWMPETTRITATLSCIGRSTAPIRDLIEEASIRYYSKFQSKTVIRRPAARYRRIQGYHPWTKVSIRPSRPMSTVVLDQMEKQRILEDIHDYLQPSTIQWYAERGVPYRRGYLFHGPPGTGKTSLSFAIAGVFNLDIYCISLQERLLTEEDLCSLFDNLPRRCVVLLEDIDSAGIASRGSATEESSGSPSESDAISGAGSDAVDLADPTGGLSSKSKPKDGTGNISLSGLLNAIDGVASHEGRVLIMTTNFLSKLDDALIRPGRVDLQIEFTLATRDQIQELFLRMFSPKTSPSGPPIDIIASKENPLENPTFGKKNTSPPVPAEEIEKLAESFAEALMADTFSPAEIQGYLLTKKEDPRGALQGVQTWMEGLLRRKRARAMER